MAEKVTIGNCELWHGDCREVLPLLPNFDLILTDPPYGIDFLNGAGGGRKEGKGGWKTYERMEWDKKRPEREVFDLIISKASSAVIWGGNYFADVLPVHPGWLVWDKMQSDFSLADCEFAWTTRNAAIRRLYLSRAEAMKDGKQHPTQKPIKLMEWCMSFFHKTKTVIDPFMGSGTTGVACVNLGKTFTGIERERQYFDIACRRIEQAYAQPRLFEEEKIKPDQSILC